MRVGVAVLGLLLVAGEAQAADQFDLVCKGEIKDSVLQKHGRPTEHRYRVDVASKLWCIDQCTIVKPIAEVTPSTLTFENHEDSVSHVSNRHWVDRVSGDWTDFYLDQRGITSTYLDTRGTCEAAPFSGINPPTKF